MAAGVLHNRAPARIDYGDGLNTRDKAQGKQEFFGVQSLRAVAALLVVAGHSTDFLLSQNGWVPGSLSWLHGPAGVDIFFVISGFVMMISSQRLITRAHPSRLFLWRRIIRIVPLYWLLTLARVVIVSIKPSLSLHAHSGPWNIVSSFLFIPSRASYGEIRPVISVGWTLNFEMFFYLVFAVSLAYGRRMMRVLVPAMLVVSIVGVFRMEAWPAWTALADPIVLEFLAGVGLAVLTMRSLKHSKMPLSKVAAVAGLVAGFAGLFLLVPGAGPIFRPATWGISALLIVSAVVSLEPVLAKKLPPWLLLLGDASYSIYLVQTFIFPVIHIIIGRVRPAFVQQQPVEAGVLMMILSIIATSIAGVLIYRLIERPITTALRQRVGVQQPVPVAPA
ncbi:MAG TPA: acyltransferase [Acidobacteriaceae bacterium]|nr:acyltransferase [Acidobacteriaceae bacterium]